MEYLPTSGYKEQKVCFSKDGPIPEFEKIGEKAFKLMVMYRARLPVPNFFVGKASKHVSANMYYGEEFDKLEKPVIVRSCHPLEHEFPGGTFESIKDVYRLSEYDETTKGQKGLYEAYCQIVESTRQNRKFHKRFERKPVEGFNLFDMNFVAMEQRKLDVFGMFLTSEYNGSNETYIVYEDRRTKEGVKNIRYSRRTGLNKESVKELSTEMEDVLIQFGEQARNVSDLFGQQQIEVGYSDHGVEILQSKDFKYVDPNLIPDVDHKSFETRGVIAFGNGYFKLPVLVIAPCGGDNNHINTEDPLEIARENYKKEIYDFLKENNKCIFVLKDKGPFDFGTYDDPYPKLNKLIHEHSKAVIKCCRQVGIRHSDWSYVEDGNVSINVSEHSAFDSYFAHNSIKGYWALRKSHLEVMPRITDKEADKKGVLPYEPIETGDILHVHCKEGKLKIWKDDSFPIKDKRE
jgi:hypothetical protein